MKAPSKRTKKTAALVPQTRDELRGLIARIITAQTTREKAVAERDAAIAAATAQIETEHGYNATIEQADQDAARCLELVEMWAVANKADFGDARSIVEANARFGWRLGNWSLNTGRKGAAIVEFLQRIIERGIKPGATQRQQARAALAARYVRFKVTLDKEAAISDRENKKAATLLRHAGAAFEQEEKFYLDPEREGQKPPLLTTPTP